MHRFEVTVFFGSTLRQYTVDAEQREPNSSDSGYLYFRNSKGRFIGFPASRTVVKEVDYVAEESTALQRVDMTVEPLHS